MPRPARYRGDNPDLTAAAYFTALDIALSRGDYAAAAKAQQTLNELGWDIRHRHRKPEETPEESSEKGVAQ
jgi:hypothetical protein